MFSTDFHRVALAAVGALVLSTLSITAAVGPATSTSTDSGRTAYAQVLTGSQANG